MSSAARRTGPDAPRATRWPTVAFWWSAVGLTASVLLALLSFLPSMSPQPEALTLVCFSGMFPVFASAMLLLRPRRGRDSGAALVRLLPWVVPVAAFAWVCSATAAGGPPGQPEIHHGLYYFNNHGSLIPTTLAQYRDGLRANQRGFASTSAVFYAVAFAVHRYIRLARRTP